MSRSSVPALLIHHPDDTGGFDLLLTKLEEALPGAHRIDGAKGGVGIQLGSKIGLSEVVGLILR